jgi:hypothetical protein
VSTTLTHTRKSVSFHWAQADPTDARRQERQHLLQDKIRSGDSWLKQVLHHVWLHLHLAWKLRNADLCSIDKADEELKREAKLRPKIVAPCLDKHLFASDLDKRLDDTGSSEQTAWINLVTPTVR